VLPKTKPAGYLVYRRHDAYNYVGFDLSRERGDLTGATAIVGGDLGTATSSTAAGERGPTNLDVRGAFRTILHVRFWWKESTRHRGHNFYTAPGTADPRPLIAGAATHRWQKGPRGHRWRLLARSASRSNPGKPWEWYHSSGRRRRCPDRSDNPGWQTEDRRHLIHATLPGADAPSRGPGSATAAVFTAVVPQNS